MIEAGSNTVDALWTMPAVTGMVTTSLSYLETAAILRRKLNGGVLDQAAFSGARFSLQRDVFHGGFHTLTADTAVPGALALIDRHNLDVSDAAILAMYLRHARTAGGAFLLLAADRRLRRAATAEGLTTLNPEALPAPDVPALLASL